VPRGVSGARGSLSREYWGRFLIIVRVTERQFGRGERDSPATTDLPITIRLAEPPEPFDWLRSA
jgi:hypothetical protein